MPIAPASHRLTLVIHVPCALRILEEPIGVIHPILRRSEVYLGTPVPRPAGRLPLRVGGRGARQDAGTRRGSETACPCYEEGNPCEGGRMHDWVYEQHRTVRVWEKKPKSCASVSRQDIKAGKQNLSLGSDENAPRTQVELI